MDDARTVFLNCEEFNEDDSEVSHVTHTVELKPVCSENWIISVNQRYINSVLHLTPLCSRSNSPVFYFCRLVKLANDFSNSLNDAGRNWLQTSTEGGREGKNLLFLAFPRTWLTIYDQTRRVNATLCDISVPMSTFLFDSRVSFFTSTDLRRWNENNCRAWFQ